MKKYFLEVLVGINIIIGLIMIGLMVYLNFFNLEPNYEVFEEITRDELPQIVEPEIKPIAVEIKGAVANPGVYHLEEKMLIDDLVNMAGGLNANAFTDNINFSKELHNEMVIYVYTKYEYNNLNQKEVEIETCSCPEVDITPCLNNGTSIIVSEDASINENVLTISEVDKLININTASVSELTSLNGIGESKAKSIIEYRQNNGLFETIEDIKKVTGISESTYEKIKDYITV